MPHPRLEALKQRAKQMAKYWYVPVWLSAIALLTALVWTTTRDTLGLAWIVLPPLKVVPIAAITLVMIRLLLPPIKVLTWIAAAALIFLAAWILLPSVQALQSRVDGVRIPLALFVPTLLFCLAALLGRVPFMRPDEHVVLGWRWVSPKERRLEKRLFQHVSFIDWGFHTVPRIKLRWKIYAWRTVAALTFAAAMIPRFAKTPILSGAPHDLTPAIVFDPTVSTRVYSEGGEEICRFTLEDRLFVPIAEVPLHVRQAFIAAEDKNFLFHDGYDLPAILHAAYDNYRHRTSRGASTITQQVVKQVVLNTTERSMLRKVRELFLAVELERKVSKDKILEIYMNHIFLGRAYGIRAAAQAYYGKDVQDLSLAEAAFLAAMPKAPSAFSPVRNYARAKERQDYVLGRMVELRFVTEAQRAVAYNEGVAVIGYRASLNRTAAPYFCEMLRRRLETRYGQAAVYERGLVVRTTLDMRMQRAAEAAVRMGLIDLERRLGFAGPEGHDASFNGTCQGADRADDDSIEMAQVKSVDAKGVTVCVGDREFPMHAEDVGRIRQWEEASKKALAVGDTFSVRLKTSKEGRYALSAIRTGGATHPERLQAGLVSVDPKTGFLKAMVGGYDFNENQYDNAVQARRQPGSSIKPYVYLAGMRQGMTVAERMVDRRYCIGDWCPENFLGKHTKQRYMGAVDMTTALGKSLNSISVQIAERVGVDGLIRTFRDVGITSRIDRSPTISIGGLEQGFTVWEHTYGIATIIANGRKMPVQCYADGRCDGSRGVFIREVRDQRDRRTLYAYVPPEPEQAVPAADAYAVTYLMKGVVESGTGKRYQELGRPGAGKTGTTNGFKDAWFMGATADLVTGVWVGRADAKPIADEDKEPAGGAVALPISLAYMKIAVADMPVRDFPVPPGVILMKDAAGRLVPFQRNRVPKALLTSVTAE